MKKVVIVDNGFNMLFKEIIDSIEASKKSDESLIEKAGARIVELSEEDKDKICRHIVDEMISDMSEGINPIVAENTILPLKVKVSKLEDMFGCENERFRLCYDPNGVDILENGKLTTRIYIKLGLEAMIENVNRFGFNFEYSTPLKQVKRSELEKWCVENGLGYMNHKDKVGNIYTYEKDVEGRFCNMKPISPEEVGIEIING